MMVPHFAEHFAGIMMTDRDNRREKHVIARRHTLQGVVRLFIHVEESRLKPWQLEISGSAQDCAGVSKRTRQMFQAEFCLRKCFGIFIASLWKVKNSQFWFSLKETTDERDAIHLLRVTIVIEGEHKISSRLPHHNIPRSNRPARVLVYDYCRVWRVLPDDVHCVICTAVGCDQHFNRRRLKRGNYFTGTL